MPIADLPQCRGLLPPASVDEALRVDGAQELQAQLRLLQKAPQQTVALLKTCRTVVPRTAPRTAAWALRCCIQVTRSSGMSASAAAWRSTKSSNWRAILDLGKKPGLFACESHDVMALTWEIQAPRQIWRSFHWLKHAEAMAMLKPCLSHPTSRPSPAPATSRLKHPCAAMRSHAQCVLLALW